MAEEQTEMVQEQGEKPEVQAEVVSISKEDYDKMAAALKEANKEAAARRKQLDAYEAEKKAKEQAELSELEKTAQELQETKAQLKAQSRREMQRQAAEKVGLPSAFVSRLQGETLEELEADAQAIIEAMPKPEKPQPGIHPTNPPAGSVQETPAQQRERLFGYRSADPFDPTFAKEHGGGVFYIDKE